MSQGANADPESNLNPYDQAWYRALTPTERTLVSRAASSASPNVEQERPQSEYSHTSYISGDVRAYLAEDLDTKHPQLESRSKYYPIEHNDGISLPAWLNELYQSLSGTTSWRAETPDEDLSKDTAGFLYLVEPLVRRSLERLGTAIDKLINSEQYIPFNPADAEKLLLADLQQQLVSKMLRTMILELNVARVQGLLAGETSEERFQSFTERLRRRDIAIGILKEYPVLARQLVGCIDQWEKTSLEFLRRLCEDWRDIKDTFHRGDEPGKLVALEGGVGDRHRGGRSVHIATFSSGMRLVYKPRSLAVDSHFQQLLRWVNERGDHPQFRTLNVLDRGTYGWTEYIEDYNCESAAELQRFYKRQGGYLALLHALHAIDFHYENLIAAGEHPVLVDLEALFHPKVEKADGTPGDAALRLSVLEIGLLPHRIWGHSEEEGIDLSGLGGSRGQTLPDPSPYLEGVATDEMQLVRQPMEIEESKNQPTLNGTVVDASEYVDDIASGFAKMYELLSQYREELLADEGPLTPFDSDEIRYLVRETRAYSTHLLESFHPDLLRDASRRDRLFEDFWVSSEDNAKLASVFPYELEDLRRDDIPIFTARPDSRHLWSASGKLVPNYLDTPPMTLVHQRVRNLSHEDMEQQIWAIYDSFKMLAQPEVDETEDS